MDSWLVPNWKNAWRWLSVHAAALAVAFGLLPADTQASVMSMLFDVPVERMPAVLGILMLAARLFNQSPPDKP